MAGQLSKYFIAVKGNNQPEHIYIPARPIVMFNTTSQAIEVYQTPFEAFAGLKRQMEIRPEYVVTLYAVEILDTNLVYLSKGKESHIFALTDLTFTRVREEVLGSLIKYM